MILDLLLGRIGDILCRLRSEAHRLGQYDYLRKSLLQTDVTTEREYRETYRSFYVFRGKDPSDTDWQAAYFSILEREKRNPEVSFEAVLEELLNHGSSVQLSFASKLVATINPDMPVFDDNVREALGLPDYRYTSSIAERLRRAIAMYACLKEMTADAVRDPRFSELRDSFDGAFPQYSHFTDIKKLDFLMWKSETDR